MPISRLLGVAGEGVWPAISPEFGRLARTLAAIVSESGPVAAAAATAFDKDDDDDDDDGDDDETAAAAGATGGVDVGDDAAAGPPAAPVVLRPSSPQPSPSCFRHHRPRCHRETPR